jgi:hypothetical protein
MPAPVDVTIRCEHVHRQGDHQKTGATNVRRLKSPMPRPKLPAGGSPGRHGEEEQREQRQYAGVLVPGRRQLDVLDDPLVDGEQETDVQSRGTQGEPAELLVSAQREARGGVASWPNRQHA